MADVIEVVQPQVAVIEVDQPEVTVVEVIQVGPQGPPGPVADIGAIIPFVDAAVSDYFVAHPVVYVYEQVTSVYQWTIPHPFTHRPTITAMDSAGSELIGEIKWPSPSVVTISFNTPVAGRATLT